MKNVEDLLNELWSKVDKAVQTKKIYDRERKEFDRFIVLTTDAIETKGIDKIEALNIFVLQFDKYLQDFRMQKVREKKLKGYKGY